MWLRTFSEGNWKSSGNVSDSDCGMLLPTKELETRKFFWVAPFATSTRYASPFFGFSTAGSSSPGQFIIFRSPLFYCMILISFNFSKNFSEIQTGTMNRFFSLNFPHKMQPPENPRANDPPLETVHSLIVVVTGILAPSPPKLTLCEKQKLHPSIGYYKIGKNRLISC